MQMISFIERTYTALVRYRRERIQISSKVDGVRGSRTIPPAVVTGVGGVCTSYFLATRCTLFDGCLAARDGTI